MPHWLRHSAKGRATSLLVGFVALTLVPSVKSTVFAAKSDSTEEDETRRHPSLGQYCQSEADCLGVFEECSKGQCECKPYTLPINDKCRLCPQEGQKCSTCCGDERLDCLDEVCTLCRTEDGTNFCKGSEAIIMTASQIALSAALIMGITALGTLLYRICVRTNYPRSTSTRTQTTTFENAEASGRVSVSSVQERVLSRLRDRPPRYETQHNAQHRRAAPEPPATTATAPSMHQSPAGEPPPTYDDGTREANTLPPPYSEVIQMNMSIISRSGTNGNAEMDTISGGTCNPAYINTETSSIQVIELADANQVIKPNDSLNSADKVVHI